MFILVVTRCGFNYTEGMWIGVSVAVGCVLVLWWIVSAWRIQQLNASVKAAKTAYEQEMEQSKRSIAAQIPDNWVMELRRVEQQWWRRPIVTIMGKSSFETLVVQRWL